MRECALPRIGHVPTARRELAAARIGVGMVAAKKMQLFSPARWVKGQRQQPFSLESSALSQLALEFKAMGIGPQSDSPVPLPQ